MDKELMVTPMSWEAFRSSGMLWWVNRILHTFGLVIVVEVDDFDNVIQAYPAKTKFRGFDLSSEEEGFVKVSKYISDNAEEINEDANGKFNI